MNGQDAALHDILLGEDGMCVLRCLLHLHHFDEALTDLLRSLLLVLDSEVKLFDLLLHEAILLPESLNKLVQLDHLVVALVHQHEQLTAEIIETISQIFLILWVHILCASRPTINSNLHVTSRKTDHILHELVTINLAVMILIYLVKLLSQLVLLLVVQSLLLDLVWAVNVDIVEVSSDCVWISNRASSARSTTSPTESCS